MNFRICLILVFLSICSLSGQTLKTYQGVFENGTAVYQYYENEQLDRIYEGSFEYKEAFNNGDGRGDNKLIITGKYANNAKDGIWNYTINSQYASVLGPDYDAGGMIESVKGAYSKGYKNGEWRYELLLKGSNKVLIKSTVSFNMGKPIGKFKYLHTTKFGNYGVFSDLNIEGQFDVNGYIDGKWNVAYLDLKKPRLGNFEYINGILGYALCRDNSSGEILRKIDRKDTVYKYFQNADTSTKVWLFNGKSYVLTSQHSYWPFAFENDKTDGMIFAALTFWNIPISKGNGEGQRPFIQFNKIPLSFIPKGSNEISDYYCQKYIIDVRDIPHEPEPLRQSLPADSKVNSSNK